MKTHYFSATFLILICIIIMTACNNTSTTITAADTDAIQKYLDEKVMTPAFNGKVFSAHKVFKKDTDKIYVWAYMQEYYKKDNKIELGSGWSLPLVLNVEEKDGGLVIKSHVAPGDGNLYFEDIKKIFPSEIQQQVQTFDSSPEISGLQNATKKRAETSL